MGPTTGRHRSGAGVLLDGPRVGRYKRRLVVESGSSYGGGPAVRVGAGEMCFPPGAHFGPRKQAAYEIILPEHGGLVIEIDGVALRVGPGDVTLLHPGPRCVFRFAEEAATHVKYVAAYDPALPIALLSLFHVRPFSLPVSSAMQELMETILGLVERPAPPLAAIAWLITSGVALYGDEALAAGQMGGDPGAGEHPSITAVREVVRQRLSEHIALSDLAAAAHVAPEHLVRLFRQRLGTTPIRFLWAARVRLGVHLLEHSELSVGEIAARVGCQSPKHFARLVRAEVGAPPREVRRRSWSYAAATPLSASSRPTTSVRPRRAPSGQPVAA
jgi:AraC-like DNA-binding protein